ncbi:MAG: hypothetical protein ACOZE5_18035 [Verrucomicrobiota bacterium]
MDTLVKNSPFGNAPSPNAGSAAGADSPLEFRGVFFDAGETFFSLYDVATKHALWVGLKEPGNPFVVQAYDEAKGAIVVEYQGRTLTVSLKQAKVVTLPPSVVAPAVPVAPGAPGNGAPQPVVSAGTPPNEAARLAQIAEEIRRRRAIRAQALQQTAAGQSPTVPQPTPANPPAPSGTRP